MTIPTKEITIAAVSILGGIAIGKLTNEKMNAFVSENLNLPQKWSLENFKVTLPWMRCFECNPRFNLVGGD